jgi:serine O-acetyltransferase
LLLLSKTAIVYKGFILKNNLPTQKSVLDFSEKLYQYLFPFLENENDYAQNQQAALVVLKQMLANLIDTCKINNGNEVGNVSKHFFDGLPMLSEQLIKDAQFILQYDPAAYSEEEVILSYPGFYSIAIYRLAHVLYTQGVKILPRMMSELAHSKTGIDINAGAIIGCPFFIDHGTGIVIGETTIIGNFVKLYQGVTLGALAVRKEDAATKRHPTIEDNVIIYAGTTILGGDTTIGHDCIIGGNTWITENVPAFSVVYHTAQTIVRDRRDFKEPLNFII